MATTHIRSTITPITYLLIYIYIQSYVHILSSLTVKTFLPYSLKSCIKFNSELLNKNSIPKQENTKKNIFYFRPLSFPRDFWVTYIINVTFIISLMVIMYGLYYTNTNKHLLHAHSGYRTYH